MKGNAYHLNVNHFADMTDDEFDSHKGLMLGDGGYGSRDFDDIDDDRDNRDERRDKIKRKSRYGHVPEELDWRKYGMNLHNHYLLFTNPFCVFKKRWVSLSEPRDKPRVN